MTARFAGVAIDNWDDFDGWALTQGIEWVPDLPLSRFCHLVWFWMTQGAEKESDVDKMRSKVWRPPVGTVPTKGPWTPEAETAAFMSLKKAVAQ